MEISAYTNNSMNENNAEEISVESVLETAVEKSRKEFPNEAQMILEKLRNLPSTASELEVPNISLSIKRIYSKLCKALKVPENSTFLSSIESDKMDFSYQSLGHVGIIPVTKALISCKTVKVLDLKYNDLGARSLPAIISLLDQNENIANLNLSSNSIGKGSSQLLSELIARCHSVLYLYLSNNNLGDEELQEIGKALMKIDSVKELSLDKNDFSSERAPPFGSFINKCSALLKLDLSCCHLEEGAANIFGGLKISNLTNLNLSRNGVSNEAMPALASGLRANKSLKELDISYNSISNKGAVALSLGLKGSSTLEVFNIAHNPIEGSSATSLLNSVGSNLKLLDLSGIRVNRAFFKTLRNYAKSGKLVKVLFGSEIRYGDLSDDFMVPDESSLTKDNVILFLENLAEDKGVSLRNTLKNIHANFITEQQAKISELLEGGKEQHQRPGMKTEELAKALATSAIALPKSLALEVAELLSIESFVDMWDVIAKVRWKPDDLHVKIKVPKPPPPPEKSKKKK